MRTIVARYELVASLLSVLCLSGMLAAGSAQAEVRTQTFSAPGCTSWTVPSGGVSLLGVQATGEAGHVGPGFGAVGIPDSPGGVAAAVSGTLHVNSGQSLYVCVGQGGGAGGHGDSNFRAGAAGGGASGVYRGAGLTAPDLVAAGGGGGGGCLCVKSGKSGGAGGAAGQAGKEGFGDGERYPEGLLGGAVGGGAVNTGGAGVDGGFVEYFHELYFTYSGGGGGGGGYSGGGGGQGPATTETARWQSYHSVEGSGAGGAGGSNYCLWACSQALAGNNSVAPAVTLTYDVEQAPEWGRCLKVAGVKEGGVTVYHGRFTKPSCTEPSATHTGKYEWYPGSVDRPVFTLTNKPLTTVKLETVGKQLVTCTVAGGEGEITGAKTALMFVGFTGCTSGGQECHSSGFGAGGILLKFLGELVWQNQPLKKVSLLLNPLPGESLVGAWECPALGNVVFLSGSVLVPIGVDKMSAKPTLKFGQSKGKQVPSMFEGSASEVLTGFSLPTDSLEQTGLAATLVLAGEEATEVNAVY